MLRKTLALILSVIMIVSCFGICASAENGSDVMRFGSDGKFKIVVFADTQENEAPNKKMLQFMGQAIDREQPDLVVFTGDNICVGAEANFVQGATALIQPLIERNVPYAYTFGNHDAEHISKQFMHSVYSSLGRCLTYNADDSISGYGNCNIPIYASNGDSIAFNLWMIDSNMYATAGNGTYDNVHQDQLDWFARTDAALEASQGHKVNSIVFQHIALPEIYNCLERASALSFVNTKTYNGIKYKRSLNSSASGQLLEFPCPPDVNGGEFAALKNRGDVLGVVTGHDHINSFIGTYDGIDFIQMPGMTFRSYGDDRVRGYGVVEIDESNTSTYSAHAVTYTEAYVEQPFDDKITINNDEFNTDIYRATSGTTYISQVKCAQDANAATAKNSLQNAGFTVIDYDLNKGAKGQYIYMGYKTTTDYNQAIKDLRFYSSLSDLNATNVVFNINGTPCTYAKDDTDLNKGSGGDYIYACYSKNNLAGPAITGISFDTVINNSRRICSVLTDKNTPAELNNGTTTHESNIYCYTTTNVEAIDINPVKAVYEQLNAYPRDDYDDSSKTAFNTDLTAVKNFIDSAEETRLVNKSDAQINSMLNSAKDSCALMTKCVSDNGFIYGFTRPTLPEEMDGMFNSDYAQVNYQPTGMYMGTGSKVQLAYDGRQSSYTAVVFGDVNGDAWYDGQDAAIVRCIENGLIDEDDIGSAAYQAADCNHDGVVDGLDTALLEEAGVLLSNVDQSLSTEELLETSSAFNEYINLIDQTPIITDKEPQPEETEDTLIDILTRVFYNICTAVGTVIALIKAIF